MNSWLVDEAVRAGAVGALFLLVFAAAEAWRHCGSPPFEWTRKLVHFGGGLVSLTLPWIVRSHWTVLVLGILFAAIILLTRRMGLLASVHGVSRSSQGGIYFPIAVYGMFLLAADQPAFYLISLAALVVSDALAALVGSSYGRVRYRVEGDRRSIEGSLVFFLATFLAVHLPLLLMTPIDRRLSVLVAIQIALLVTLLEAISLEGNDNLIVPLGTFLLLHKLTIQTPETIFWQLAAQLAILGLLLAAAWRLRLLTFAGTLAASLFFYAAWSLGGPAWIVGPSAAMAAFALVLRRAVAEKRGPEARYQVTAVFYTAIVPITLIILNNLFETVVPHAALSSGDPFYPAFLGSIAANLSVLALVFWRGTPWVASAAPAQVAGSYLAGVLAVVPVGVMAIPGMTAAQIAVAAAIPAAALILYLLANRLARHPRQRPWDGRLRAAAAAAAALLPVTILLSA